MNWKRGLGISLIFIGIFLVSTSAILTGAVIGGGAENYLGLLGLAILVGGIVLVISKEGLEQRLVGAPVFFDRFREKEKDSEKRSIILDTSVILTYSPKQLEKELENYENVFVPDSVLNEIYTLSEKEEEDPDYTPLNLSHSQKRRKKLRKVIEQKAENIADYEQFRGEARKILEQTEKAILKRELLPYLKEEREIEGDVGGPEYLKIKKLTERLRAIITQESEEEKAFLESEEEKEYRGGRIAINLELAMEQKEYSKQQLIKYLENCEVSEADIDVLAMGMSEARNGYHALIGEKDLDLREGIEIFKAKYSNLEDNLDFVEPYDTIYKTELYKLKRLQEREVA